MPMHDLIATAGVAAQVILTLTFVSAAVAKIRHTGELIGVVQNYRLLPAWAVEPSARLLPWAELAVAASVPLLAPAGAIAGGLLLTLFGIAMAVNLRRGRAHIDCGCGQSALTQRLRWGLVWRNFGLLLLVPLAALPPHALSWSDLCNGLAFGLAIQLLLISTNSLLALGPAAASRGRRIRVLGGHA